MKFLESGSLAQLTAQLTDATIFERVINGRIEAFTMKRAGTDKKLAHELGEKYRGEIKAEETEFSTRIQNMQRSRSESLASIGSIDGVSLPIPKLSPNQNTISPKLMLYNPPSPKPKRVRIDTTKRPRSYSTGTAPLCALPSGMPKSPALRTRSDSFDVKRSISTTFPYSNSPLGDFHESCTQRLMTDLILTLNSSFPDYDFSNTRPSHFSRLPSPRIALNRAGDKLSELAASSPDKANLLSQIWLAIDDVITLNETEVYSYIPPNRDDDDDPLDFMTETLDGSDAAVLLWGFNFFFVNKSQKRIVFFTCIQTMRTETETDLDNTPDDRDGLYTNSNEEHFADLITGEYSKDMSSVFGSLGSVAQNNSALFSGGGLEEDDEEEEGGLDFDMDADCMNQAVSVPHATVV